jgi:hypothetical protein
MHTPTSGHFTNLALKLNITSISLAFVDEVTKEPNWRFVSKWNVGKYLNRPVLLNNLNGLLYGTVVHFCINRLLWRCMSRPRRIAQSYIKTDNKNCQLLLHSLSIWWLNLELIFLYTKSISQSPMLWDTVQDNVSHFVRKSSIIVSGDTLFHICPVNNTVQTGSGAHPASCPMGTGGSFAGGKVRPERDADHSPPSSAEVKYE